jgi:hypothetical protein
VNKEFISQMLSIFYISIKIILVSSQYCPPPGDILSTCIYFALPMKGFMWKWHFNLKSTPFNKKKGHIEHIKFSLWSFYWTSCALLFNKLSPFLFLQNPKCNPANDFTENEMVYFSLNDIFNQNCYVIIWGLKKKIMSCVV